MHKRLTARLLVITAVFGFFFLFSCTHQTKKTRPPVFDRTALIVDSSSTIREPLRALMSRLSLPPVLNLKEAVAITQKNWIRGSHLERNHLSEHNQQLKSFLIKDLGQLGLLEEVLPERREYDYALVLGATYKTFKSRLSFLENLSVRGIVFKHIALLGSVRPLEPDSELKLMAVEHAVSPMPTTEIEMMEMLFGFSSLKGREWLRIASPMKLGKDGHLVRANTKDTVIDFLRLQLKAGSVLVISNQPYLLRQGLVVSSVLKSPWQIESVGPEADKNVATSVFLDELARTLYEIEAAR